MPDATLGEWYVFFRCKDCSKPILVAHDPSGGKVEFIIEPGAQIQLSCTHCGKTHEYLFQEVKKGKLVTTQ